MIMSSFRSKRGSWILFLVLNACLFIPCIMVNAQILTHYIELSRPDVDLKGCDIKDYTSGLLEKNPYLTIAVSFRNEEALINSKNLVERLHKIEYFYAQMDVNANNKNYSSPLFVLKKTKDKFSISNFVDNIIVNKIPFQKYSNILPKGQIISQCYIRDQFVTFLKDLTASLSPIISEPSSIFGPNVVAKAFNFLNDVIKKCSEMREVNIINAFDIFKEKGNLLPTCYVFILYPSNISMTGMNFELKKETDGRLYLYQGEARYTLYPYFIVEMGVSNYLEIEGMPSKFYNQNSRPPESNEYESVLQKFNEVKDKLSDDQIAAENAILKFFSFIQTIKGGLIAQQNSKDNLSKLADVYYSLYDCSKFQKNYQIKSYLFDGYYKTLFNKLEEEYEKDANLLEYYRLTGMIFKILPQKDNDIDNVELGQLYSYLTNTAGCPYLGDSAFNRLTKNIINAVEEYMRVNYFLPLKSKILEANDINPEVKEDMANLQKKKGEYFYCTKCQTEFREADIHYRSLMEAGKALWATAQETIDRANNSLKDSSAMLQIMDFNLSKIEIASASDQRSNELKTLRESLADNINQMDSLKKVLNDRIVTGDFTSIPAYQIRSMINNCDDKRKLVNDEISEEIKPFLKENRMIDEGGEN